MSCPQEQKDKPISGLHSPFCWAEKSLPRFKDARDGSCQAERRMLCRKPLWRASRVDKNKAFRNIHSSPWFFETINLSSPQNTKVQMAGSKEKCLIFFFQTLLVPPPTSKSPGKTLIKKQQCQGVKTRCNKIDIISWFFFHKLCP